MKAKKVYEFKRTRKRGLSKQTEIGLNHFVREEIIGWFNEWFPDWEENKDYEIINDLLIINKIFDLGHKDVKYLPKTKIKFKYSVFLHNTPIEKLPNDIISVSDFNINWCPNLKELPSGLYVKGDLRAMESKFHTIPSDLIVKGLLDLRDSEITYLPDNLDEIHGHLDLSGSKIEKLPDNLIVHGNLNLKNTPIAELPYGLSVLGNLNIENTEIEEFPDDLYVKEHIVTNRDF